MSHRLSLRVALESGFTLIELMIVVAIIGLLAALAIPNFIKFQTRARQSEAKANLKAAYTAQRAYYGDQSTYYDEASVIGFRPEFNNRYSYFFGGAGTELRLGIPLPPVGTGASVICPAGPQGSGTISSDQNKWGTPPVAYANPIITGLTPNPNGIAAVTTAEAIPAGTCCPQGYCEFASGAGGNIDSDNAYDVWFISSQGSVAGGGASTCQNATTAPTGLYGTAAAGEPVNICSDVIWQ